MDSGLVTSLSGALAQSKRIDKIANNLANADTPAFKSDNINFEEALQNAHRMDTRSDIPEKALKESEVFSQSDKAQTVALHGSEYTNFSQGSFRQTNQPFDVAIEGNGFLEVATANGIRLTRAGNLTLDAQGQLTTRDGFLVLGPGQATQDPATRAIKITDARPVIDSEGNIYSSPERGGATIGRLSLVRVENPAGLKKEGGTLYTATPEAMARPVGGAAPAARAPASTDLTQLPGQPVVAKTNPLGGTALSPRVHQGVLEASNVNPIQEMSSLIQAHRLFDQNLKMMQTFGDTNTRAAELGKF